MRALFRSKFRVKIKSLAAEASIIRQEESRHRDPSYRGILRWHRIEKVRFEQRATLLAYAYFRGVPYNVVENNAVKPLPHQRILAILGSLAFNRRVTKADLEAWAATSQVPV